MISSPTATATATTMRASTPQVESTEGFEYLLLGDLRWLLDEIDAQHKDRWLLAILDKLLSSRPQAQPAPSLFGRDRGGLLDEMRRQQRETIFGKLQKLRDRIAHRSPYQLLANEIRCELQDFMLSH